MATKANSKSKTKRQSVNHATLSFIGGSYNNRTLTIVYPSPEYLVLDMGRELYERQDPPGIVDAVYKFNSSWENYERWLAERETLFR